MAGQTNVSSRNSYWENKENSADMTAAGQSATAWRAVMTLAAPAASWLRRLRN